MLQATTFIARALGFDLTVGQKLAIIGAATSTSKGASDVTGVRFVTLTATRAAVDPRLAPGMALLLGVDKFIGEWRAPTTVCGNDAATIVVAAQQGELDQGKLARAGEKFRRRRRARACDKTPRTNQIFAG